MFNLNLDKNKAYVVGYSTGVDSTALLHYMLKHKYKVRAVFCKQYQNDVDPMWEDEDTAIKVCQALNVPLTLLRVHSYSKNGGLEANTRNARYFAIAGNVAKNEIFLTAHHANDQVETVLLKFLRGTGLSGMKGMQTEQSLTFIENNEVRHLSIVRPLLNVSKDKILQYAQAYNLEWYDDISNQDRDIKRNFVRLDLLPLIAKQFNQFEKHILKLTHYLQEAERNLMDLAEIDLNSVQITELPLITRWDKRDMKKMSKDRLSNMVRYYFKKKYNHILTEKEYHEIFKRIFSVNNECNIHNKVKIIVSSNEICFEKIVLPTY